MEENLWLYILFIFFLAHQICNKTVIFPIESRGVVSRRESKPELDLVTKFTEQNRSQPISTRQNGTMNPPLEREENTETLSGSHLSPVCDSWVLEKFKSLIPGLEPFENFNRSIMDPVIFRGSAKNTICNKNNKVRKNVGWDEANIMGRGFKMTLWLFRVDCLHWIGGNESEQNGLEWWKNWREHHRERYSVATPSIEIYQNYWNRQV